MRPDDLILISVDDHLVEPPDMFEGHLPAKYADRAPRSCAPTTAATSGCSRAR